MPARGARRPGPTAQRILDEAEVLFAERGYQGASLAEVADRVGIRGPSLFSHFKSKRELYEAVLQRLLDPFFAMLDDLARGPRTTAGDRGAVDRMMRHHAHHPRLAGLIQQAVLGGGEQLDLLIDRWYRPFFARVRSLVPEPPGGAEPSRDGDPAAVIMGFNCLILGYVTLAPLHARLLELDPLAPEAVDRYVAFLRALPRRNSPPR